MTTRRRFTALPLAVCLLAGPGSGFSTESSGLLDGMSFVGINGEKGNPLDPDEYEEIVFAEGMFRSLGCEPYEFGASNYAAERLDDKIHFQATILSPTHGKIHWKGVIDGSRAQATFVWTKERWYWDTRREYWFEGTLKE